MAPRHTPNPCHVILFPQGMLFQNDCHWNPCMTGAACLSLYTIHSYLNKFKPSVNPTNMPKHMHKHVQLSLKRMYHSDLKTKHTNHRETLQTHKMLVGYSVRVIDVSNYSSRFQASVSAHATSLPLICKWASGWRPDCHREQSRWSHQDTNSSGQSCLRGAEHQDGKCQRENLWLTQKRHERVMPPTSRFRMQHTKSFVSEMIML